MTVGNADAKITAEAAVTFEDLVAAEARSDSHSTVQEATADAESFDQLSLMRLVRLVRSSSMQELERARDSANIFHEFAKALGPLAKRQFGAVRAFAWLTLGSANDRTVAFLIPGFVWIRHSVPGTGRRLMPRSLSWPNGLLTSRLQTLCSTSYRASCT